MISKATFKLLDRLGLVIGRRNGCPLMESKEVTRAENAVAGANEFRFLEEISAQRTNKLFCSIIIAV